MGEAIMTSREKARQAASLAWLWPFFVVLLLTVGACGPDCREATIQEVRLFRLEDDRTTTPFQQMERPRRTARNSYEIILRLGENVYTALYQPRWKWSLKPKELTVGDEVPVRIDEKNIFLNCGSGKEVKIRIVESKTTH
jgi:hypothetical protein